MRVTFHREAEAELAEAVEYYERQPAGLGTSLLGEIERAIEQLADAPETYQKIGRRVRRKLLWRFPYSIVFAADSDLVRVVAIAHQKRRPFYWRKRMTL